MIVLSTLISILKVVAVPGSLTCLLLCSVVGVALMYVWPRNRRLARVWLLVVFGIYLALALPCVANALVDRLPKIRLVDRVAARLPVDTLVVLAGDNDLGRVRTAKQVYALDSPEAVWVLGKPELVDALVEAGIPRDRIAQEAGAPTTRDQMARLGRRLADSSAAARTRRAAIIASRLQMPRISALARAEHLAVTLIASPVDAEPPMTGVWRLCPSYAALCVSRDAIYEHAAFAYYRWRGWI